VGARREPAAPAESGAAPALVDAAVPPGKPTPVAWAAAGPIGPAVPPGKPARPAAAAVGAAATPGKPLSAFKAVLAAQEEQRDRWQVAAAQRA